MYNVHVWSSLAGNPRKILNAIYMRIWQRIVGDPRYGRTTLTDAEVRSMLEVPSIDTHFRRLRLFHLSRISGLELDAPHASLQQRGKFGEKLPWVRMVTDDLQMLRRYYPSKLENLPMPDVDILAYWRIARDFPNEWRALVRRQFALQR